MIPSKLKSYVPLTKNIFIASPAKARLQYETRTFAMFEIHNDKSFCIPPRSSVRLSTGLFIDDPHVKFSYGVIAPSLAEFLRCDNILCATSDIDIKFENFSDLIIHLNQHQFLGKLGFKKVLDANLKLDLRFEGLRIINKSSN